MSELPEPPVPADVDLRDFAFTPIFRTRLFGSAFNAQATDSEWRAGVTLWLRSWDQVPAGSLPNSDTELCRLADLGRDLKRWRKLRAGALHGWFQCKDERLYHLVVAEGVIEAHQRRRVASRKGKLGASIRWHPRFVSSGIAPASSPGNGTGIARAMPGDSNRQGHIKNSERARAREALDVARAPARSEGKTVTPDLTASAKPPANLLDDSPRFPEPAKWPR